MQNTHDVEVQANNELQDLLNILNAQPVPDAAIMKQLFDVFQTTEKSDKATAITQAYSLGKIHGEQTNGEQSSLFDLVFETGHAQCDLEKVETLINHLINEYGFNPKPSMDVNAGKDYDNAHKIIWEYNNILNFLHMISDYVYNASKRLKEAEKVAMQARTNAT